MKIDLTQDEIDTLVYALDEGWDNLDRVCEIENDPVGEDMKDDIAGWRKAQRQFMKLRSKILSAT